MILSNWCAEFGCVPSVLLEEDPAEISGILEARHGQHMKRLLEADDGPAPSPAQVAFWELLLEAMGDESEDGQGIM